MWTINFLMFKLVLEKAGEAEIKLPTSAESWKKQESSRKNLFLLHWLCQAFDCVDDNKLWKILQEMGIPDHLICLLRNLYADQEETVRAVHGTTVSNASPSICHEVIGLDAMILVFWTLSFQSTLFSLSSFTFIKRLFSSSLLSTIRVVSICISEDIDISPGKPDSS